MAGRDDDFDAELADRGDDRPGVDELDADDWSGLGLRSAASDEDADDDLDEDDEDDDEDYPEDATDDEIDFVGAFYREDGEPAGAALAKELANDLDGLIEHLRRVPGDAGAAGVVMIDQEFFVLARVRGRVVQVVLSDSFAAHDWPIARDAIDFLGLDVPDDEDDSEPVGDLDLFADAGLSEIELDALCSDDEYETDEALEAVLEKIGFADAYDKVAATFDL